MEKKGFHILLDAKDPGYDLVFVGPGTVPEHARLPGVYWLGAREQAEIAELHRASDLFAFPSVGEIFTLVMQEAIASGLPVVTTDDAAYTESLVSGYVILSPRSVAGFRPRRTRIAGGSRAVRGLAAGGRELALRHFDWRANFNRMMTVYSDVLREGAA